MSRVQLAVLGLVGVLAMAPAAQAQVRPYLGFVYPAGGQQGTTFRVKLGGQGTDGVDRAVVSGPGVSAKVVEYFRRIGPQDMQLMSEQLRELRGGLRAADLAKLSAARTAATSSSDAMMMSGSGSGSTMTLATTGNPTLDLMARIHRRMSEYVNRPACISLSALAILEVQIAPDARPGQRELRVITPRGVSNPLVFDVGQVPEISRKPMKTAEFQVLGKEYLAQRVRPDDEVEQRITVPCTANGQIASGEVNYYRFEARMGQRLVISTQARQLIPYVADAVPGWFQPVLALHDANGKEVAYNDDFRFKPDPMIFFEVPKDGEYVLTITDAIYRGREDFVYRLTVGELPRVTSIFPLGARVGAVGPIEMKGWNLEGATLARPPKGAGPGICSLAARKEGFVSNRLPFALDTLPEALDKEPNNEPSRAQKVKLPIILNGRIDRPDDWDVFQFTGRADDTIVAEVDARRLDSPLDSVLKLTDANGKVVAFNDDHDDPVAGVNTHDADSYLMAKLPADGTYYVHLGDAARHGGEEYAYRLRISPPRPDFALRVVPSSISLRSRGNASVSVYVVRKDGFTGPIKLGLKDPPEGFSSFPVTLSGNQTVTRLGVRTSLAETERPVNLVVQGRAKTEDGEIAHDAVPAEDRMQAFLWRHLVPAEDLKALVFDPSYEPPPKRVRRVYPATPVEPKPAAASTDPAGKRKFTKQQVAGRLRQLKALFEEGLLTDEFDHRKVMECEAAQ